MPACLRSVIPSRNEEDVGAGAPRADHLLLDAPDRRRRRRRARARRSRRPCRPRSTLPRSSSTTSRANASPAEGPPTPPRSISTPIGSLMSANCSTWMPTIGRPGSSGLCDRADLDDAGRASGRARAGDRLSRLVLRDQPAQVVRRPHGRAVDRDDHLGRLELARRGRIRRDRDDERALGLRRRRRTRARGARRPRRPPPSGPSGGGSGGAARRSRSRAARAPPRGRDRRRRAARRRRAPRAATPCGRSRRRSRSRPAPASFSPCDLHLRLERLRRVGQQQVAVRGKQPRDAERDAREDQPACR